jgi:hypothetical protein
MLQEFLNANLIPITDENHFGKLKKTADEIVKKLIKSKPKIQSYTLTALDPDVSPDNPDIIEVKEIVTKNWSTFTTNSKDTAVTVIRAVMFEALQTLAKEINLACLIWLSGRNVVKHFNLIGKEKEIVTNFLLSLGKEVEDVAVENWILPPNSKFQQLSLDIKEITGALVDKATLQKLFAWASGPNDDQNVVPFKEPNSVWPNSGYSWSYQFAPKAATAISQEVNKVLKEQAKLISINQAQIQEVVNKILSQLQSEILERNSLLQMRTQLLWWKESCYSISINQSYRQQANGVLQILLAKDYSIFVPIIYPNSADYFLKETHRTLEKDKNEKIKISEILKQVEPSKEILKNIFEEPSIESGRISLYSFVKGFVWDKYNLEHFKVLVGFADSVETTLSDFTVWMFHDLQSLKISTSR